MVKTKAELISEWLDTFPGDFGHADLEFNAIAGYVESNDGWFFKYSDYREMDALQRINAIRSKLGKIVGE